MPYCTVPGCTNDSKTTKEKEISFHRLTKDKKLSKIWIEKTKRLNPPKRQSCYVYSEQCFNRSFKFELTGQKDKKTLLNTWCSSRGDHFQVQKRKTGACYFNKKKTETRKGTSKFITTNTQLVLLKNYHIHSFISFVYIFRFIKYIFLLR